MKFVINSENDGRTVKEYIYSVLHLSTLMVTRLKKKENGICLCGKRVTVRAVMHDGDELALSIEDDTDDINSDIEPVQMDLSVVFEDDYILVVNKPGGMPVHPSHNHHGDSLANGVLAYYKQKGIVCNFRAVNRLDCNTSGLVIVAKGQLPAYLFSKEIMSGRINKTYNAILCGTPVPERGTIRTFIKREKESIITRCNCGYGEGGSEAITEYETLEKFGLYSLVKAMPKTGRTHQLRVHFAGIGNPIAGDTLYGSECNLIGRQALHAASLEFVHPFTGEKIHLNGKLPEDMENALLMLRENQ